MAMNRVQFQPGLSMAEFIKRYSSEEQCGAALAASRWPPVHVLVRMRVGQQLASRRPSVLAVHRLPPPIQRDQWHHIFESSKLGLARWFLAMHMLTQLKNNVSARELRRHLGVCNMTAWLLKQTAEGGRPVLICLSPRPFTKESMLEFAAKSLALPLTLVSDGLGCFTAICGVGAVHDHTVTGGGKACVELPQFRAVNTLLGNLKTALSGTCHAFEFGKYAHRYLAEVQYHFNRRFDLASILVRLVRAAVTTSLQPGGVIRAAEPSR